MMYAKMCRGTPERLARPFPTICIFARVCKNGRWNSSSARFFNCTETVSLLLLCNVLSDIECNRNYDNDTLCDVLVVCINTKVL